MSCKEIAENVTYTTELIRETKANGSRWFCAFLITAILCIILASYIVYDRILDSKFDISATEVEVVQDGQGYNNFIHGTGDIINGTESED